MDMMTAIRIAERLEKVSQRAKEQDMISKEIIREIEFVTAQLNEEVMQVEKIMLEQAGLTS